MTFHFFWLTHCSCNAMLKHARLLECEPQSITSQHHHFGSFLKRMVYFFRCFFVFFSFFFFFVFQSGAAFPAICCSLELKSVFCMHFGARISHLRAHLAFGFKCPLGFLAFGFWLCSGFLLAFSFWLHFGSWLLVIGFWLFGV